MATLDVDGNGEVDFEEFIRGLLCSSVISITKTSVCIFICSSWWLPAGLAIFSAKSGLSKEAKLKFAFRIYDMDGDGYLSNADLVKVG